MRGILWLRGEDMNKQHIGKVLRDYRKKNNLTVNDVALKLEEHSINVSPKSIYGWENGQTQPNAETLLVLCEIYNIEQILFTFGYRTRAANYAVSEYENRLLKQYRAQPHMHDAVHKLLDL